MECREREIQCKRLKPKFLTPQMGAAGPRYIGKRGRKKGGEWNSNFPPKVGPPGYKIWGETEGIFVKYLERGSWPAGFQGFRWPVGQGSKGSMKINGRPCQKEGLSCVHNTTKWSKTGENEPERENATFRRGSKGSHTITGRPYDIGGLPGVYNTNM